MLSVSLRHVLISLRQRAHVDGCRARTVAVLSLYYCVALSSCTEIRQLAELQQDISRRFATPATSVEIYNGTVLSVSFANSSIGGQSDDQREVFARKVAEYVRDHYAGYPGLSAVAVSFTNVSSTGPITLTSSQSGYTYTVSELEEAIQRDTSAWQLDTLRQEDEAPLVADQ